MYHGGPHCTDCHVELNSKALNQACSSEEPQEAVHAMPAWPNHFLILSSFKDARIPRMDQLEIFDVSRDGPVIAPRVLIHGKMHVPVIAPRVLIHGKMHVHKQRASLIRQSKPLVGLSCGRGCQGLPSSLAQQQDGQPLQIREAGLLRAV